MEAPFSIAMSFITISLVMLLASLLFKDKEGDKPARFAFRVFYFSALMLFIFISLNIQSPEHLYDILIIFCIVFTNVSLVIGIVWRCKSIIPIKVTFILSTLYLISALILDNYSVQLAYLYTIISSLISVYALLNRKQGSNTGDKGMAMVILVNTVLLLISVISFFGLIDNGYYDQFIMVVFIFTPAYLAGLTIFLFSSYMLDAHNELTIQATTDYMTGLFNRRFFLAEAKRALHLAERHQDSLCVMMCDIDYFKAVNDNYGHKIGDIVIKTFTDTLKQLLRSEDILARYGGEEFVALLPQTKKQQALIVVERMRSATEKLSIQTEKGLVTLTASFGVCEVQQFSDIEHAITHADRAMYHAKQHGRNSVKFYEHDSVVELTS